jgi:hypothetical protein
MQEGVVMPGLSPELEESLWGDAAILRSLEQAREAFEAGDRSALVHAIILCARFQAVIPEWAADAILEVSQRLESGDLRDFNEAFGWKPDHKGTRRKMDRQKEYAREILSRLHAHRLAGGNLNAEEAFQPIAEELGISRRDVEEVYRREGQFIKSLPRGNPEGRTYGFARMTLQIPRRRGRPISCPFQCRAVSSTRLFNTGPSPVPRKCLSPRLCAS